MGRAEDFGKLVSRWTHRERRNQLTVHLVFQREEVSGRAIEFLGPAALACGQILEINDDANFIAVSF